MTDFVELEGEELLFEHGGEPSSFRLPDDALERIRPVSEEVSEILNGADYVLTLTVVNLPQGAASDEVEPTGLKWPKE